MCHACLIKSFKIVGKYKEEATRHELAMKFLANYISLVTRHLYFHHFVNNKGTAIQITNEIIYPNLEFRLNGVISPTLMVKNVMHKNQLISITDFGFVCPLSEVEHFPFKTVLRCSMINEHFYR